MGFPIYVGLLLCPSTLVILLYHALIFEFIPGHLKVIYYCLFLIITINFPVQHLKGPLNLSLVPLFNLETFSFIIPYFIVLVLCF